MKPSTIYSPFAPQGARHRRLRATRTILNTLLFYLGGTEQQQQQSEPARHEETGLPARVILKPKRRLNPAAKRFFDLEADLGSDDERHDDRVKKIRDGDDDAEDDEDNNDLVDDSFVDNAPLGDDVLIAKAEKGARELYLARQAADDQFAIQQAYDAVFLGQNHKFMNKKRRLDDLSDDESEKGG